MRLTKKLGVSLRQSYARVGKLALIKHQRYAHAHQFKRANRSLRKLKTYLGRVIRDIERRIVGNEDLREAFVRPLFLAGRVLEQERRQRAAWWVSTKNDRRCDPLAHVGRFADPLRS